MYGLPSCEARLPHNRLTEVIDAAPMHPDVYKIGSDYRRVDYDNPQSSSSNGRNRPLTDDVYESAARAARAVDRYG